MQKVSGGGEKRFVVRHLLFVIRHKNGRVGDGILAPKVTLRGSECSHEGIRANLVATFNFDPI